MKSWCMTVPATGWYFLFLSKNLIPRIFTITATEITAITVAKSGFRARRKSVSFISLSLFLKMGEGTSIQIRRVDASKFP